VVAATAKSVAASGHFPVATDTGLQGRIL
jgi:hypothetical protein